MRTLLAVILIATYLCASEPWEPVRNPELRSQEEVTALMRLAYRSTAAGLSENISRFGAITCARIGDEVIVRGDDSTTYRVNAVGILESWPISAEETIKAPSPAESQIASLAVTAARCNKLPLTSTTMTAWDNPAGTWIIRWETGRECGQELRITKSKKYLPGVFFKDRSWSNMKCGGGRYITTFPTVSG